MKKQPILISLLLICCLIVGCPGMQLKAQQSGKRIPVAEAINKHAQLKASDYFQSVEYIPLEFTDKCPISGKPIVRLLKDRILIFSPAVQQCYLFNRSTGRFIASVGHVGNDPEGASELSCWVDYDKSTIYIKGWKDILQIYNSNGVYQGRLRIPDHSFFRPENDFMFLPGNRVVQYFCRADQKKQYLKFFANGSTQKEIPLPLGDTIAPTIKDIHLINVISGDYSGEEDEEYGVRYFTPRNVYTTSQMYSKKEGLVSMNTYSPCLWQTGRNYYFKEPYNDTIFEVGNPLLQPAYVLDMGKLHWDKQDRFKQKKDRSIFVTNILDSKNFLLVSCVMHPYEYRPFESYNVVWNKKTGAIDAAPLKDGFVNDIHPFMDIHPLSASPEGDVADLIPAEKILTWFDENKSAQLPASLKKLKSLKEDDNPVVVILKGQTTSSR